MHSSLANGGQEVKQGLIHASSIYDSPFGVKGVLLSELAKHAT